VRTELVLAKFPNEALILNCYESRA